MTKTILTFVLFCLLNTAFAQSSEKLTTIDFVQILNDNKEEAIYYYKNNWEVMRKRALEEGYIHSYQLLEVPFSEEAPFHIMLMTTYANKEQDAKSEDNFAILIEEKGPLRLLNDKKPGEFRKIIFNKDKVKHLD